MWWAYCKEVQPPPSRLYTATIRLNCGRSVKSSRRLCGCSRRLLGTCFLGNASDKSLFVDDESLVFAAGNEFPFIMGFNRKHKTPSVDFHKLRLNRHLHADRRCGKMFDCDFCPHGLLPRGKKRIDGLAGDFFAEADKDRCGKDIHQPASPRTC